MYSPIAGKANMVIAARKRNSHYDVALDELGECIQTKDTVENTVYFHFHYHSDKVSFYKEK